ncbi:MAG TPA: c-type cytochrome [Allosphingosinicella sp.]|nr:c-type cytochrome [Allosphingosinicella sp.]
MRRRSATLLLFVLAGGCDTVQSVTGGDGLHSRAFNDLFAFFLAVTGFFYLLVLAFLAAALLRRRGRRRDGHADDNESRSGALRTALFGWIALMALGLTGLSVGSFLTDRRYAEAAPPATPLLIEVTANQWWWDVKYQHPDSSQSFRTANELHLPVGVPARIILKSNDVIHSFWVPNIAGKQDLIPGRVTDAVLVPRQVGWFRGQCAEFCGAQHAHMALDVRVEPRADFVAWRLRQLGTAPTPATPLQQAGYDYFMNRECSSCHMIAGTPASGQIAPDLTHLASRKSIAAGTFPMTRGHLYGWIADPQGAKPGNNMPYIGLEGQELHALVAYLETLK